LGEYDITIKEIVNKNPKAFIKTIFKLRENDIIEVGEQSIELPKVLEKRADAIFKITRGNTESILHLEFQSSNDTEIGRRMTLYRYLIAEKYPNIPVIQAVIYIGDEPPTMQTEYSYLYYKNGIHDFLRGNSPLIKTVTGDYEIIDLGAEKLEDFLQKTSPDFIGLIAVVDRELQNKEGPDYIKRAVKEIKNRIPEREKQLEAVKEIELFFAMRYPTELIGKILKEEGVEKMIDWEKTAVYKEALEKGLQQGLQQGLLQGEEKTKEEIAIKMLKDGEDIEKIQRYTSLNLEKIKELDKRLKEEAAEKIIDSALKKKGIKGRLNIN